ncbi:MAG TPA: glycogen synthase GlgA [Burkholderiaceae bacterium]|nr:glycogen synthase GlgA [Burkholderiaceae bacterium]
MRQAAPPRVLHVAAEIHPFVKTGGLADVLGALPAAQATAGADVRVLLPGLPPLVQALREARTVGRVQAPWGGAAAEVVEGRLDAPSLAGVRALLLRHEGLYARAGTPYGDGTGHAFADNHRRFALLGLAAARLAEGLDAAWSPHVVHGHDWHAGLACAYAAFGRGARRHRAATVFTIHNLAFQGLFEQRLFVELGLPIEAWSLQGLEFHGQLSFMKAGLHYADRITTVSPSYAREIQGHELGAGLDGLLRERAARLSGILNGVDDAVWNPASDRAIAAPYSAGRPAGKASCKAALQRECSFAERPEALLFAAVSRLTEQKGLQLLPGLIDELVAQGGQLVVLGSGDAALEAMLREAARRHPQAVALRQGHDEALAHRIFAGSDVTLVPSRFEPCGLTQMYALRYGSLPLVRRTGGLADTVVDCTLEDLAAERATGFVFERFEPADLRRALQRAFTLWTRRQDWRAVQRRGMQQRFGWDVAAARYLALYRDALAALSA